MCGICGFVTKDNITVEQLKEMNDTMYHRGPNDSGEEIYGCSNGYTLGLAQRRLSILDLSSLGHQPMHSSNGRVSIVYNGECYNFLELREELSDYTFLSHCDTEVIVAAYLKWGIDCVSKLKGMFAIAIYDRELEMLYLVRDRIGKKPLYYWYEDSNLVFASELKPIMKTPGFQGTINRDVIKQYLYQLYIQAPNTIYEHVYKLEPGSILTFQKGTVNINKYWDVAKVYHRVSQNKVVSYEEAKRDLKELLSQSVERRMIADVPLGTFLSGGYDSSLITAMAQSVSDVPIKTFSIGFLDKKYNEAAYAKEVAEYLGTEHTEFYVTDQDMFDMIEDITQYYDEPFADSSQIPTMLVSKLAREQVTVALSGDGGDEFFCGYNVYEYVHKAQQLDGIGSILYAAANLPLMNKANLLERLPFAVSSIVKNRNPKCKTQFTGGTTIDKIDSFVKCDGIDVRFLVEDQYQVSDWQIRRMLLDMETYLPGDILCKVDRASMKYSLEARCPILDTDVMEYSFRLPHYFKYKKGEKKRILKDITYEYIPKELLERPKVGFSVPLDTWLRGPLRADLLETLEPQFLLKQGLFHERELKEFVESYLNVGDQGARTGENYSRLVWAYYMFQKWYQTYCKEEMGTCIR